MGHKMGFKNKVRYKNFMFLDRAILQLVFHNIVILMLAISLEKAAL